MYKLSLSEVIKVKLRQTSVLGNPSPNSALVNASLCRDKLDGQEGEVHDPVSSTEVNSLLAFHILHSSRITPGHPSHGEQCYDLLVIICLLHLKCIIQSDSIFWCWFSGLVYILVKIKETCQSFLRVFNYFKKTTWDITARSEEKLNAKT